MSEKWVEFCFSKLVVKDDTLPNLSKIILMISTEKKVNRLKCPRILKNKVVNFFGQKVAFPMSTNQFTIIISEVQKDNYETGIGRININRKQIQQLTKKEHHFTVQNQMFALHWSAKIVNSKDDDSVSNITQRDLSQIDMPTINFFRVSRKNDRDEVYSPGTKRKSSGFFELEETYSDLSPKKKLLSNRTQVFLRSPPSIGIIQKARTTSRRPEKKRNKSEEKKKKYSQVSQKSKKTSTSQKSLQLKYNLRQFICAGVFGAFAGFAFHNFY